MSHYSDSSDVTEGTDLKDGWVQSGTDYDFILTMGTVQLFGGSFRTSEGALCSWFQSSWPHSLSPVGVERKSRPSSSSGGFSFVHLAPAFHSKGSWIRASTAVFYYSPSFDAHFVQPPIMWLLWAGSSHAPSRQEVTPTPFLSHVLENHFVRAPSCMQTLQVLLSCMSPSPLVTALSPPSQRDA